ncbi:hypothetical protein M3148_16670 [Georgenia satyanarayanai]|uniref:hypothetical protein n=1 Tax=Georgenia satyanarayanai TaxID=860221 RepID=UPI0020408CBE|nr:hypothetical protein [Georgenia satyanarayanai]MCM3662609.1 hypothetical protein [Georgenia satyanarayanai]
MATEAEPQPPAEVITLSSGPSPIPEPVTTASGVAVTVTPYLRDLVGADGEVTDQEVAEDWGNHVVARLSPHEQDLVRSGAPVHIVADPATHQYVSVTRPMVQPQAIYVDPVSSCTRGLSQSCLLRWPLYLTDISIQGNNGYRAGTWRDVKTIQAATNRRLTFGHSNGQASNTLNAGSELSFVNTITVNSVYHHD